MVVQLLFSVGWSGGSSVTLSFVAADVRLYLRTPFHSGGLLLHYFLLINARMIELNCACGFPRMVCVFLSKSFFCSNYFHHSFNFVYLDISDSAYTSQWLPVNYPIATNEMGIWVCYPRTCESRPSCCPWYITELNSICLESWWLW